MEPFETSEVGERGPGGVGIPEKGRVVIVETMSNPTRWAPTSDKWSYNPYTVIIYIYIHKQ